MSNHTPGPWLIETFDDGDSSVGVPPTDPLVYHENDGQKVGVCQVFDPLRPCGPVSADNHLPTVHVGLQSANARLIAAAPDLFEACEAVAARLDYLANLWGDEGVTRRLRDQLGAALRKATVGSVAEEF